MEVLKLNYVTKYYVIKADLASLKSEIDKKNVDK